MGKVRKHIRNLHDGTEDGERLFDAMALPWDGAEEPHGLGICGQM